MQIDESFVKPIKMRGVDEFTLNLPSVGVVCGLVGLTLGDLVLTGASSASFFSLHLLSTLDLGQESNHKRFDHV